MKKCSTFLGFPPIETNWFVTSLQYSSTTDKHEKWALILNKSLYHILSDLNFDHKEEFLFELINLNGFILYKFTNFPLIPFWEIFLSCCLFCWELIDFYGQITGNDKSAVISYSKTRTIMIKTQKKNPRKMSKDILQN